MDKKIHYKIAAWISILYVLCYVLASFYTEFKGLYFLFSIIGYPYLIYKLKCHIYHDYNYAKANIVFYIAIATFLLSFVPVFGVTIFDIMNMPKKYQNIYFIFSNVTLVLKGAGFFVLGILLSTKLLASRISLKLFNIAQIILGIDTMFIAIIGIYPKLTKLFSHEATVLTTNFLRFSIALSQLVIFVSLLYIFNYTLKPKEEVI